MHPQKTDSILNKISEIADGLMESLPDGYQGSYRTIPECWEKQFLIADSLRAYENIQKDLLLAEKWHEKFSEISVDEVLRKAISNTKKYGTEEAKRKFDEDCVRIESYSSEHAVYIPLGGIQIDKDVKQPISLGKVELIYVDDAILEDMREKAESITKTMNYTAETLEELIVEDREHLAESFLHKVCAIHHIVAEPKKALEVAEVETQKALNLLRYAMTDLYNRDSLDVKIDVSSQIPNSHQKTMILSSSYFGKQWRRSTQPYYISPQVMDFLEAIGVFDVSKIMKKHSTELNEFEETLLVGMYWFGNSQTHSDMKNEFLTLTTCLEVFFTPKNRKHISNSIAEGTAIWISSNLEERKGIKERIKSLYSKRSKVSHGVSSLILDQEIADLRILTRRVVTTMIKRRNELKKRVDIATWIKERKLS